MENLLFRCKRPSNGILPVGMTSQIFVPKRKIWKTKEQTDSIAIFPRMGKRASQKLSSNSPKGFELWCDMASIRATSPFFGVYIFLMSIRFSLFYPGSNEQAHSSILFSPSAHVDPRTKIRFFSRIMRKSRYITLVISRCNLSGNLKPEGAMGKTYRYYSVSLFCNLN